MILDMLFRIGSAEKRYECFDWAQHERKLINVIKAPSPFALSFVEG